MYRPVDAGSLRVLWFLVKGVWVNEVCGLIDIAKCVSSIDIQNLLKCRCPTQESMQSYN